MIVRAKFDTKVTGVVLKDHGKHYTVKWTNGRTTKIRKVSVKEIL